MATILSSKTFLALKDEGAPRDEILDWLFINGLQDRDCAIEIQIKTLDKGRMRKTSAKDALKKLMLAYHDENFSWGWMDYEFYFGQSRYLWKGKQLHVTPSEALFLFRWLALADADIYRLEQFHLTHMRQKFGKDFLTDFKFEAGKQ